MESKTLLLDLPNELFPLIFQYLKALDILKAFVDFKSRRMQVLIRSFVSQLDISYESDEWIQHCLPNLFTKYEIIAVRVQIQHLTFIWKYLLSTNIQSMEVVSYYVTDRISEQVIGHMRRHLKKLSFVAPYCDEHTDLARLLFRFDSQLECLTMNNYVLYLSDDAIDTCPRLTHLSIELTGIHPLFILMEHLPNLQELKVSSIHHFHIAIADELLFYFIYRSEFIARSA